MTRILVFGGRTYFNEARIYHVLDAAVERLGLTEIIHGDHYDGADAIAKQWAVERGIPHTPFPANWSDLSHPDARIKTRRDGTQYDANAGPRRNQAMADAKPDAAIGFPGDRGSRDMLRRCRTAGIEPYLIDWKG